MGRSGGGGGDNGGATKGGGEEESEERKEKGNSLRKRTDAEKGEREGNKRPSLIRFL